MTVDNSSAERPEPCGSSGLAPLARRRLIKSAIGTPVVLSSLASKPVLGGTHGCGVSNAGSPTPNSHSPAVDCSLAGQTVAYWKENKWSLEGVKKKTPFNGFEGLSATYFRSDRSATRSATMWEVLNEEAGLGPATVVSLLNAISNPSYPVTKLQIVSMFNAASKGQDYPVGSGSAALTPQQVLTYLQSLYRN